MRHFPQLCGARNRGVSLILSGQNKILNAAIRIHKAQLLVRNCVGSIRARNTHLPKRGPKSGASTIMARSPDWQCICLAVRLFVHLQAPNSKAGGAPEHACWRPKRAPAAGAAVTTTCTSTVHGWRARFHLPKRNEGKSWISMNAVS